MYIIISIDAIQFTDPDYAAVNAMEVMFCPGDVTAMSQWVMAMYE